MYFRKRKTISGIRFVMKEKQKQYLNKSKRIPIVKQ